MCNWDKELQRLKSQDVNMDCLWSKFVQCERKKLCKSHIWVINISPQQYQPSWCNKTRVNCFSAYLFCKLQSDWSPHTPCQSLITYTNTQPHRTMSLKIFVHLLRATHFLRMARKTIHSLFPSHLKNIPYYSSHNKVGHICTFGNPKMSKTSRICLLVWIFLLFTKFATSLSLKESTDVTERRLTCMKNAWRVLGIMIDKSLIKCFFP